jgi:hypothetical protein
MYNIWHSLIGKKGWFRDMEFGSCGHRMGRIGATREECEHKVGEGSNVEWGEKG